MLSERDKGDMDTWLVEELGPRAAADIVTRQGSPLKVGGEGVGGRKRKGEALGARAGGKCCAAYRTVAVVGSCSCASLLAPHKPKRRMGVNNEMCSQPVYTA